jgi:hypothetical protein
MNDLPFGLDSSTRLQSILRLLHLLPTMEILEVYANVGVDTKQLSDVNGGEVESGRQPTTVVSRMHTVFVSRST